MYKNINIYVCQIQNYFKYQTEKSDKHATYFVINRVINVLVDFHECKIHTTSRRLKMR